jgi:hypothetical protein
MTMGNAEPLQEAATREREGALDPGGGVTGVKQPAKAHPNERARPKSPTREERATVCASIDSNRRALSILSVRLGLDADALPGIRYRPRLA